MAGTDVEKWRNKYFDSLGSLEKEQQQFRALEASLKRLVGRLCVAALGQSSRLDDQIKRLQTAIRREAAQDELDRISPALTDAIQALDHRAPAAPAASTPATAIAQPAAVELDRADKSSFDDERIRSILTVLLAELRRDSQLIERVDALDAKLAAAITNEELPEILSSLTDMVASRIKHIESAKIEIEVLLTHMVGKLDEIGQFVAEQNKTQNESQASSETLNVRLAGEMKAMGESVEAANDLQQIRMQVRNRLDSIDRHLQEFRERETSLSNAMRARNDHMRSRIAELETEASRLQQQLQVEQQRSTMDVLTRVPNRLAYEQRIDDELQRWQRFKQPTCIAVLDVDHFKRVNDTYGHRAGDRVLRAVAKCLATRIRSTDFVARYGGEEFVMILTGTQLDDAIRVIDGMRSAIAELGFHFRGTPVAITVSSGVTPLSAGDTSSAAFQRADKALYRAKQSGRNRCVGSAA
ncbi:MAG: diguanylate cyclase [Steroidobacteraceae bacterium]